jgi:hypothetical protein
MVGGAGIITRTRTRARRPRRTCQFLCRKAWHRRRWRLRVNLQHRCHRNGGGCTRSASSFETTSVELTRGTRIKQVLPAFSYLVSSQWSVPTAGTAMALLAACINRLLMQHGYAFSFNFECLVFEYSSAVSTIQARGAQQGRSKGPFGLPMIVGRLLQKLPFLSRESLLSKPCRLGS